MPPLDGTLALAEVNQVAVVIPKDLDFDVARALDRLFDVYVAVAERPLGFAGRIAQRRFYVGLRRDQSHALAAAPRRRLQQDRVADFTRGRF